MSEEQQQPSQKTPKHLWFVGTISLLWNAMGAFDYLMMETRNEGYLEQFSQAEIDYFTSYPSWAIAAWAIAVWGGVLGSALLLLRKGVAATVFIVSLVAMVANMFYSFALSEGIEMMGTTGIVFSSVIFAVGVLLIVYSRKMAAKGVLR